MEDKNKNIKVIALGFLLVIAVVAITFLRPLFSKKSQSQSSDPDVSQAEQSIKSAKQISVNDLLKKITGNENVVVLDIRSSDEFKAEHIIGSKNISASDLSNNLASLDKSQTYVIVDDGNSLDGIDLAGNTMPNQGFGNVYYLTGGFPAWKNQYGPTISAGDPNSFVDQSKVTYITSDQLKDLATSGSSNLFILDVRDNKSFAAGHLEGAVNIFLDDLEADRGEIPINKEIIAYDNDGLWAFQAAVRLYDMGFFNVRALSDGFNAWQQKGYKITK